ncbi:sigma-70 family RNA polymerase sigma factor [Salinarimonas soli]|nr:sigma-70 family RNA polymerase sigma factor [Salinarimonas soli]
MRADEETLFRNSLLAAWPRLWTYAYSLSHSHDRADDLAQETIAKALANSASFEPGTRLVPWLYSILRNQFYSEFRRRRREVEDVDGLWAEGLVSPPDQIDQLNLKDLSAALAHLDPNQREAVYLVGVDGLTYPEAAEIANVDRGTIASRLHRARKQLAQLLGDAPAGASTEVNLPISPVGMRPRSAPTQRKPRHPGRGGGARGGTDPQGNGPMSNRAPMQLTIP